MLYFLERPAELVNPYGAFYRKDISVTPAEARKRAQARPELNAFISLTTEDGSGPAIAVKDLINVRGTVTTAGSNMLPDVASAVDAPVILEIRKHGFQVMGKTNLHEWAYGATSNNRFYGPVRNPNDPTRTAGGSSGGSAAAVAAGMCDWAIGTDTTGSVRIPAALCGVVGMRPSVGLVPTEGVIPISPSMDVVGPLARDVRTAASALEAMSGIKGLTPESEIGGDALQLAIADGWDDGLDEEVAATWSRVTNSLPRISFPERRLLWLCASTITLAEGVNFHREWIGDRADCYEPSIRADLEEGLRIDERQLADALALKEKYAAEIDVCMTDWDAVLIPATSCVAPIIGSNGSVRERLNRFARPLSLSARPVICLPVQSEGLPVGIQLLGHEGEDAALLKLAAALEHRWIHEASRASRTAGSQTPS